MPFSQLGDVGLGQDHNVGSPRGNGNYANLGSNNHGTVLLASNLYMDDGSDNLKIANNHPTMAGAAIQIPGNGQPRQNHIEFWTTPPNAVNQGDDFGDINNLRVVLTPTGNVGIGTPTPEAAVHIAPHQGSPDEEIWIEASDPRSGVTAFTRLRAVTSNGVRESQLLFGGECSFVWLPSRDGTGGQVAKNTLTLLVNTDDAGNVTARFDSDIVLRNDQGGETIRLDRQAGGLSASSTSGTAVSAQTNSQTSAAVAGINNAFEPTDAATGVLGQCGIAGNAIHGIGGTNAGLFDGHVQINGGLDVTGELTVLGGKHFVIDHPCDPANKYLLHCSVEAPEMINIYNGNVITDEAGTATVFLPNYFEALNCDFRYQLTVIGQFAQAIIAEEIVNNRFVIKTNQPHVKVSWQVAGVRQDAYAKAHPVVVERDKPSAEKGRYLHPLAHNSPGEKELAWEGHR
jgi:hypothetical protein